MQQRRDFAKGLIKEFSSSLEQSRYFTQSLQLDAERLVLETLFKIESLPNSVRYAKKSQDKYLKLLLDEEKKDNPGAIFAFIEFERRYNEAINDEINSFTQLMKSIVTLHFALGKLVNCEGLFNDPMTDQVYPNGPLWQEISQPSRQIINN
jgi:hypothetical protein